MPSRTKNQRLSSVYRNAAFRLFDDYDCDYGEARYSCIAVDFECTQQHRPAKHARDLYAEYFKPKGAEKEGSWWPGFVNSDEFNKQQSERNLALLFMAEIAKDL